MPTRIGTNAAAVVEDQAPLDSDLERVVRALLFVDLVESVRLMESNEADLVRRWRKLVRVVESDILPPAEGRLIKNMGDGLMLEFPNVQFAIRAAFAIQHACSATNEGLPPDQHMSLRGGAHVGQIIVGDRDFYGRGVNLASRLATLAGPGEIVVSADARDQITPVLDAVIEDLGGCYLKHLRAPVRAYRVSPPGQHPVIDTGAAAGTDLRPTVAVIPFSARGLDPEHRILGEVLADEIICALSHAAELNVISRLSTTMFRWREASLQEVSGHLNANYVLSGAYRVSGRRLRLTTELVAAKSGSVVWSETLEGSVGGILSGKGSVIHKVVTAVGAAVMASELLRAQSQPLPTLESYALLMGAIALMHRLSSQDFDRAELMLQALTERAPRQAVPWAWMAKWHVLRVQQGWCTDPAVERQLALDCARRALDSDPRCSLALAVSGLVHTNLMKQLDVALEHYDLALRVNPNDALAWLLKGTLHAFKGEGKLAVAGTERALRLSPLDPHRYFYDSLAATAAMSAGQYERAIALARRSLRANRAHTSTYRALAISQWLLGREQDARETAAELLRLEPALTIKRYLERSPCSGFETGKIWSGALRAAGVPQ
jgi:class 3 adenylate cyclase/TolB-like protein/tetratricopeptide (TPR) repeat protein